MTATTVGRPTVFTPSLLTALTCVLALGAPPPGADAQRPSDDCARPPIPKVEGPGVWQTGPTGRQVPLWPAGHSVQPPETGGRPEYVGNGSPMVAGRTWNWATYVSVPTMTIYEPTRGRTGAAMVVLPGGGYAAVAMDFEGTEICEWITAQGVTFILLKYRVPLAAAVSNAPTRTYIVLDSADRLSSIPNFAILLYPGRIWDGDSRRAGLPLAPWVTISRVAPPTLLIHAMNDPVDDVRHSAAYGLALHDAGVAVDMRCYARGCHAFGLRPTSDPITTEWPNDAVRWLRQLGVLAPPE